MNNQPGSHVGNNPTLLFSRGHPYGLQLLNKCRKDFKYLNNAEWERRRDHSTAGFLPGLAGELCVSQWPYRLDHDWLCRWPRAAAARQTQVFVWPWPSEQLFYAFIMLYIPQPGNSWSDRILSLIRFSYKRTFLFIWGLVSSRDCCSLSFFSPDKVSHASRPQDLWASISLPDESQLRTPHV